MSLPRWPGPDESENPVPPAPAEVRVGSPDPTPVGPPPSTGVPPTSAYPYAVSPAGVPHPLLGGEAEALRKARKALGWAIGAAVAAGLALLGVAVALVLALLSGSDDPSGATVWGTVIDFHTGSELDGDRLAVAVTNALYDAGATVDGVSCSTIPAAQVASSAVCQGSFDGVTDWARVVHVLDEDGSILVQAY